MSKNNDNILVPKFRFTEFKNDGSWNVEKLESYIDLFSGIALKSEELSDDKSGIPILRGINITEGYIRHSIDIDKYFLGELENLKRYLVKEDDIVIGMDGSKVGKNVALVSKEDENSILIQRVARIRTKQKSDINYIYQYLISDKFRNYVDTVNTSSGIPHISAQQIKDFEIGFPPKLNEQKKIAGCLTSLDELIIAESQKLDTLQAHKRGLLQSLLPVDAETIPKFRFKEFQDSDAWAEATLLNIANFRRGSFPQPYGLPEWYDDENGMPFIQVFDVGEDFRLKPTTKNKISELAARQSVFIPKGTLIVTLQGSIGRVAITQYDSYIDRTLLLFEEFHKEVDLTFFAYTIFLLFEIEKEKAPGGIIKTITKEVLSSFVVKMPSIKEQKKIASCLSSLDELISAQGQKVEALNLHKKGLIQGLFPNVNEVTA
jgi:hypothetical protein